MRIVPASVDRMPTAPEKFTSMTSDTNAAKFFDFKSEWMSSSITVPPAIRKEKFWVNSQY